jgi:hypothetical protein
MQFFRLKMAKSKGKWQWYRLGHNPGLVRILTGKQTLGVFHTLPCSLLKNHQKMKSEKAKAKCPEEEDRLPLSRILTDALQRRVPEDVED